MHDEIWIAGLSLIGTCVGSLSGIMAAGRMTNFRLASLEEKVNRHNNLVERMARVEQSTKSAHHRLDSLEREG